MVLWDYLNLHNMFYILPMTLLIGKIISFSGYVQTGHIIIFFYMVPWDHLNLQDNVFISCDNFDRIIGQHYFISRLHL